MRFHRVFPAALGGHRPSRLRLAAAGSVCAIAAVAAPVAVLVGAGSASAAGTSPGVPALTRMTMAAAPTVTKGQPYAEIESVKAVSDVVAPLSGEIVEVNEALASSPETVNDDPYGEGWLVKVRLSDPSEAESLMSAADYQATLQ